MHIPRLKEKYIKEIIPSMKELFQYKSVMQVPRIQKICINKGIGAAVANKKLIELGIQEITAITGQKAITTRAKKSVSNFKLRENMPIGVKVTLRNNNMFEFMDRLVNVALPRVRDFRGISKKGFDKYGNYTMGIKEQIIFPEISIDKVQRIDGMNITFVIASKTTDESYQLMKAFGMPFASKN